MSYTCEILSSESQSFKLNFIPIEVSDGRTVFMWFNSSVHQMWVVTWIWINVKRGLNHRIYNHNKNKRSPWEKWKKKYIVFMKIEEDQETALVTYKIQKICDAGICLLHK